MKTITFVTGSAHKLREWQRLFPDTYKLESVELDLDEIQSLDTDAIIKDKAMRAYDAIHKPVVVEDVSAGLDKLHGLPGPFIKYFEEKLGNDALYQLAGEESAAVVLCSIAYYDGENMLTALGELRGRVVSSRGKGMFGFDSVFIPDGQTKTYAEMGTVAKDKICHRTLAIKDLVSKLNNL